MHHALRILGEIKDAEASLQALNGAESGQITVGLVSTAKYFMPRLLAKFAQAHPGVDVQFTVGNRASLLQKLQDKTIDLAIMGRLPQEIDTHAEPLASHPYVLIAPPNHPWWALKASKCTNCVQIPSCCAKKALVRGGWPRTCSRTTCSSLRVP